MAIAEKNMFLLAVAVTTSVLFSSCESSPPYAPASGDLLPLSPGNYWSFQVASAFSPSILDTLTMRVEQKIIIRRSNRSYEGYVVRWYFRDNTPNDWALVYQNELDGLHLVAAVSRSDTLVIDVVYLKKPAFDLPFFTRSTRWKVPVVEYDPTSQKLSLGGTMQTYCVGATTRYSTPEGDFFSMVFFWTEKPQPDVLGVWNHYEYWAPGIGPIGQTMLGSTDSSVITRYAIYQHVVH